MESSGPGAILFALRREAAHFLRRLKASRAIGSAPCSARVCHLVDTPFFVLITGMGPARTNAAISWLLGDLASASAPPPGFVVSAGFAAGLTDELAPGRIVVGTEVVDVHGNGWPTTWECKPAERRCGRMLTVSAAVATVVEKRRLGTEFQALSADMESSVVAKRCTAAGIPFGCVRAISDDLKTDLPAPLAAALQGGDFRAARLVSRALQAPWSLIDLCRLARHTRLAARNLAVALVEMLKARNS